MIRTTFALSLLCLLAACGNSGGGGVDTTAEVSLVLTDAASDELSVFEVDVQNVVFTKVNGNTVDVLPRATRVDFLELESLGDLIVGRGLESGAYRRITLELDFAAARVLLAGETTPATVRDADGAPITGVVPVTIDFPTGSRPLVRAGRNNLFVLDLNLDQSVVVDAPGNAVTFTPVWTVEVDPSNPKPIATNGSLLSIDTAARTFVLQRLAPDGAVIGDVTVATTNTTVFQLGGVVQTGAPGLGSLLGFLGGRVFVQGTLNSRDRVLTAVAVEAGAGVPGNGQDWVLGHVVARTGGVGADATLSVLGRSFDTATGTRRFHTLHTVNASFANTKVLRRLAGTGLDTDAINVGQLVWIFGDLTTTTLDASAASGVARLLPTGIFGIANGAPSGGTLSLDLVRFDLRDIASFDFVVAGVTEADPDAFTVDVTGLATTGITTGSKLRVLGWIAGVGASGADATAVSITNRGTTAQVLFCQWSPALAGVLSGAVAQTLTLDVGSAQKRSVTDGFGSVTLATSPAPRIVPLGTAGLYSIVENGSIEANLSFDTFRTSLLARASSSTVFRVSAFGTFDAGTQAFSALLVTVVLH